ncbi:unnamed protein product [Thlaspi arvense]|uniref:Uncharacterized protein n=1 Tax=Thlaspi arvense TaxID=13288 RepID=A0AAU9S6R5_THLAR|nr:unnamed protein product [Thlaspi arvense]
MPRFSNMAKYTPKNILITGAAGFIASHVANRLVRNYPEYNIVVLDKLDYCSNLKNLLPSQTSPNFKFVKGDIGSADLVNFLLVTECIDTIMHFAAQTHVDNSFGNSFEFTKNNIYGTHVLLEACKVTGQVKRFIHVSTDEVYGETEEDAVRYFLDDEKLKILGWSERTSWEEGLKKTIEWYTNNHDWWGNVSGALIPHPRMLMMPGGIVDGAENYKDEYSQFSNTSNQSQMVVVPTSKNSNTSEKLPFKFLIYGRTGWIGGLLGKLCQKQGIPYEYGWGRLEERSQLLADIQNAKPTHVFNAAGVTGRPNVDWCETHKIETIRANVSGTLNLADICRENGLLMVNFATGCIFEYDAAHPQGSGIGFKEEDKPNFTGSFYSKTKAMKPQISVHDMVMGISMVEELLREFNNVCNLRVRMPISSDLSNPRNFITKITRYNKVLKKEFPDLLPIKESLIKYVFEPNKKI